MTKPLVHQSFIQVQDPERDRQTKNKNSQLFSHVAMQRRISTKLCMKIEDVHTIIAPPLIFSVGPVVSELGDSEKFCVKCRITVFAFKFLIYHLNRTIC